MLAVGRDTLDLRDGGAVIAWIEAQRPDAVVMVAAIGSGLQPTRNLGILDAQRDWGYARDYV